MSSRREDRERERRSFPERRERASNRAPRDYYNNDRTGQKYPRELINEMCAREQLRREAEGEIPWSKGEKNFRNGYYAKLRDEMDKLLQFINRIIPHPRFTENVQKGYKIITKKVEPLPLSENFPKVKRSVHVKGSETATQRKTFENLTNKFSNLESVPSTTPTTNFDEQSCSPNESCLNANERNTRKVAVYIERNTTNILVTTKAVHPEVVEKCVELQLAESLQNNKNRKIYNLEINLKESHNLANPLSVGETGSKAVLSNVDEVCSNKCEKIANDSNIPTALKPSLAKRKRIITEDDELQSALRATAATAKVITAECNGKGDKINTRKRARIMSLYERRYQADESRGGQQGVVGNGYLGSARNSSAASSATHSDANTDISNQYYIATSSANSSSPASGLVNGSAPNYAPSMATLCNIGNTCYLNSVVYTLRFAPKFVHNLHHLIVDLSNIQQNIGKHRANKSSSLGRNISGAQMENARSWSSKDLASFDNYNVTARAGGGNCSVSQVEPQKTSQQLLTEKLHELYQNLHRNEIADSAEPFHADILLHAIQDVSSIFEGNQQQDAHEFLMCVLNSIRETCQTLIKAIADYPDVILNGCGSGASSCNDQVDTRSSSASDKDARSLSSQIHGVGGGGNTGSNLSTSSITKTSFFSRKSKRKEESKSSKNQRLQSPLKDTGSQSQSGSNSLFYLNTVDLSAANGKPQPQTNSRDSHANSNSTTTASTLLSNSIKLETQQQSGDDFESPMLKDKEYLAEKIRQLGLDFFRDDFEGITVSSTKCLSCETITEQKEIMIDIAVPVPISGIDNTDYMDKSTSFIQNSCITREYFRGENKYRCEQCTGYTEAIRSISYEVLPRLLVIQLSRFSGGMEKINSYIPTSFTLQCFCAKCCKLNDENKLHTYKLYSVITHVGATMSVGHYIAYTCCLDWANEYINCPKDLRRNQQFGSGNALQNTEISATSACNNVSVGGNSITTTSQSSAASAAASALASSGTSLIKKMKFGRSKASSSGDMSKNVKNLNGVTSRTITNGIGQLSMNATCHSIRCCATRFGGANEATVSNSSGSSTTQPPTVNSTSNSSNVNSSCSSGLYLSNSSDLNDENITNGSSHQASSNTSTSFNYNTSGYGSTGRGSGAKPTYSSFSQSSSSTSTEPVWYMCDDDKIKTMTQREFEELLSPSRKITITPYLLFYTRIDLQTAAAASSQPPTKQAQTQATAWSPNDAGAAFLQRVHMDKM